MARRNDPSDEAIRALVHEALSELGEDLSVRMSDKVMDSLVPVIGAAAERRRNDSALREAFKEGFFTNKQLGQFSRWHSMLWRNSAMFRGMKAQNGGSPKALEAQSRYADFNY